MKNLHIVFLMSIFIGVNNENSSDYSKTFNIFYELYFRQTTVSNPKKESSHRKHGIGLSTTG